MDELMDMLIGILAVAIAAVAGLLGWNNYSGRGWIVKCNGKRYNLTDDMEKALNKESGYAGLYMPKPVPSDSKYMSTIDCDVVDAVSGVVWKHVKGMSDRDKAEFILNMIQRNITYVKDSKRTEGMREAWYTPVDTLRERKGDCEDVAHLYAGIAKKVGLEVRCVRFYDHMAPAVCVPVLEGDRTYTIGGRQYVHAETTGSGKLGRSKDYGKLYFSHDPETPSSGFKSRLVRR